LHLNPCPKNNAACSRAVEGENAEPALFTNKAMLPGTQIPLDSQTTLDLNVNATYAATDIPLIIQNVDNSDVHKIISQSGA
jgi:hypothetical protein